MLRKSLLSLVPLLATCCLLATSARSGTLHLPPEATDGLRLMYSGDPDAAIGLFRRIQQQQPDHPLGYLLEANARWWKIYCAACEVKWRTIDAWKRPKRPEDEDYFVLVEKAIELAEGQLQKTDSAEMRFYAGAAWLLKARLHGLRDEKRATARAGVKAREHLLRAIERDLNLADAYTGLGLYNYYADTLSRLVKFFRFFMGIPGGNKMEGIRQLEIAIEKGELTAVEARFYLAKNLRNYDQKYEEAAGLLEPLLREYPENPVFLLLLGDMNAKLSRNAKAAESFHAAEKLSVRDSACAARVQVLAKTALAALQAKGAEKSADPHSP